MKRPDVIEFVEKYLGIELFAYQKAVLRMFGKGFNSVTINGQTITCSGSNISVMNGSVIVDGKVIKSGLEDNVKVVINGDVNKLECAGSVEVHGNSGSIDCSGSCKVDGDVKGDIDASGSVMCGNVSGNIDCSGSVRCRKQ